MLRSLTLAALPLLAGCVAYNEDPTTGVSLAEEVRARSGGAFTYPEAVALALRQNAELRELELAARAAGANVPQPFVVQAEWRSGMDSISMLLDPVALLGLGPRGADRDLAAARAGEAVSALAVARWRVATELATAFAIDAALAALRVPDVTLDADAFEAAGLAAPAEAARVRATQRMAVAEQARIDQAVRTNRAELCRLVGLHATSAFECRHGVGFLVQPTGTDADTRRRPDLALALARFHTADADFRRAVTEQYPSFVIGPEVSLVGAPLEAMGMLRLPFGMDAAAEAARLRRDAAREAALGDYLRATREAVDADLQLQTAELSHDAADDALHASAARLAVAQTTLEVEIEGFTQFAEAAQMAVRDAMEHRLAATALAAARVERARAYGWPVVGGGS